jgi:phosphatidylglycerophosphatase A
MWIACFPLIISQSPWPWIVLSFVLFRVFDIWKPFPISYFDRLESSYGVMMDDVLAGLISAFALSAIILS